MRGFQRTVTRHAGRTRIKLRKTGETYSLVPPNSKAHNVIVGGTWVDCYGDFKLSNVTTGTQCSLFFTPCGWFGSGRYEVSPQDPYSLGLAMPQRGTPSILHSFLDVSTNGKLFAGLRMHNTGSMR